MSNYAELESHHLYDGGIQSYEETPCEICGADCSGEVTLNGKNYCDDCFEDAKWSMRQLFANHIENLSGLNRLALKHIWDDLYLEYLEDEEEYGE